MPCCHRATHWPGRDRHPPMARHRLTPGHDLMCGGKGSVLPPTPSTLPPPTAIHSSQCPQHPLPGSISNPPFPPSWCLLTANPPRRQGHKGNPHCVSAYPCPTVPVWGCVCVCVRSKIVTIWYVVMIICGWLLNYGIIFLSQKGHRKEK